MPSVSIRTVTEPSPCPHPAPDPQLAILETALGAVLRRALDDVHAEGSPLQRTGIEIEIQVAIAIAPAGSDEVFALRPGFRAERMESSEAVFRREGDYWSIEYHGCALRLQSCKGLRYLAELLRVPGRDVHVLDLCHLGEMMGEGRPAIDCGSAPSFVDARARTAYKRRLREVCEELEQARSVDDRERLEQERELLLNELARGLGLRGRDRKAPSNVERARQTVTKAIKHALERIRKNDARLGHHLSSTIKTGTFCSYAPEPAANLCWRV